MRDVVEELEPSREDVSSYAKRKPLIINGAGKAIRSSKSCKTSRRIDMWKHLHCNYLRQF
jgi:hypothetical protein